MQLPKEKPAKLPLPPAEIARIDHFRGIIGEVIDLAHKSAIILHHDIAAEAEDRQAARAARAAARAAAAANPPKPPSPKPNVRKPGPGPDPATQPDPEEAEAPPPRRAPRYRPETLFNNLIRTITDCMRLDAWFAEKRLNGYTTADVAGLYHPNRQPILDYLHGATRHYQPYQSQRMTHNTLETRITEELAWAPNRNPGDIIAEIATQFQLPHNPQDYPNNWRPKDFDPSSYRTEENWTDILKEDPPIAAQKIKEIPGKLFDTVVLELGNRGLL